MLASIALITPLLIQASGHAHEPSQVLHRCWLPEKAHSDHHHRSSSDCPEGNFVDHDGLAASRRPMLEIPVVFHIIDGPGATATVTADRISDQMKVLNRAFQDPVESGIRFVLTDVTYTFHPAWSVDDVSTDSYWDALARDPRSTVNVYVLVNPTPVPGVNVLGYVTELPGAPAANNGAPNDRIVIKALTVGDEWNPFAAISSVAGRADGGTTLVHEMGHYLGLEHVFQRQPGGPCATLFSPFIPCANTAQNQAFFHCLHQNPYTSGDLIKDTPPIMEPGVWQPATPNGSYYNNYCGYQATQTTTPIETAICGLALRCTTGIPADRIYSCFGYPYSDSLKNYMSYSDDMCVSTLSEGQTRRMRCTIDAYRPGIATPRGPRTAQVYCVDEVLPNSTGATSRLLPSAFSSASLRSNDLTLELDQLPSGVLYIPLISRQSALVWSGTSQSPLCLASPYALLTQQIGVTSDSGAASIRVDWHHLPDPGAPGSTATVAPGDLWHVQVWHRDPFAAGVNVNLTNAVRIGVE